MFMEHLDKVADKNFAPRLKLDIRDKLVIIYLFQICKLVHIFCLKYNYRSWLQMSKIR